jgi:hypothetical protein
MSLGRAPLGVVAHTRTFLDEMFRGQDAGSNRLVNAFDLEDVQRTRGIADQHRARHLELGQ